MASAKTRPDPMQDFAAPVSHVAGVEAAVDYLVCAEVCVPGSATVTLTYEGSIYAPLLDQGSIVVTGFVNLYGPVSGTGLAYLKTGYPARMAKRCGGAA